MFSELINFFPGILIKIKANIYIFRSVSEKIFSDGWYKI